HVVGSSLQDLTTNERNIIRDGFLARTRQDEIRCPDVSLSVLVGIEDVTKRVQLAVKPGMKPHEAYSARTKVIKAVERNCKSQTGLWGTVASLYEGECFHLYSYKVYHDVRLVFAPETRVISAFDVCFLRAYENDRPVKPEGFIPWSEKPAQ